MPIYMDRHYLEGATRQTLEMAHNQDLEIQEDYDVKLMTYWFDETRSTAFCLAEAPDAESLRDLHAHSHGSIPNEVLEVDPITVQAFLGRIEDPVKKTDQAKTTEQSHIDPAFRLIMFTDLKDSTQIAVRLGDEKALHLLRVHNSMIREAMRKWNGREVKTTGDGFMLCFDDAVEALDCAVEIQNAFAEYNEMYPLEKLYVRIGVAAGEPIEEKGDFFGTAVILASRLCAQAKAGGVLVTEVVRNEIKDQTAGLVFTSGGKLSLKGFDQPVDAYEVGWE